VIGCSVCFLLFGPFGFLSNSAQVQDVPVCIHLLHEEIKCLKKILYHCPIFVMWICAETNDWKRVTGRVSTNRAEGRTGRVVGIISPSTELSEFGSLPISEWESYRRPALDSYLLFWLYFTGEITGFCLVAISVACNDLLTCLVCFY